jgi:hypothetical protein
MHFNKSLAGRLASMNPEVGRSICLPFQLNVVLYFDLLSFNVAYPINLVDLWNANHISPAENYTSTIATRISPVENYQRRLSEV